MLLVEPRSERPIAAGGVYASNGNGIVVVNTVNDSSSWHLQSLTV